MKTIIIKHNLSPILYNDERINAMYACMHVGDTKLLSSYVNQKKI